MDDLKSQDLRRDDIDLLALLERGIYFFKKYQWLFIAATIIGLLLGFLRYRSLPVLYKSRLVLQSALLTNQNNIQIVANWNSMLKTGEHGSLASIFNMPAEMLKKVKDLKADEIQKIFTPQNPNGFIIDARVSDASVLPPLQNGIAYGFDNNGLVKEKLVSKRNRLNEMISKTAREIQRLDSLKNTMENILNGKRTGNSLIIDMPGISRQLIDMNEKYLGYKEELNFTNAVQVVQGFNATKRPVGNNLFVWLILGLVPCLAIAYIVALFHSINQKLKLRAGSKK